MKMSMRYACPKCQLMQNQEVDFENAKSGYVKFWCKSCGFENAVTLAPLEEEGEEK